MSMGRRAQFQVSFVLIILFVSEIGFAFPVGLQCRSLLLNLNQRQVEDGEAQFAQSLYGYARKGRTTSERELRAELLARASISAIARESRTTDLPYVRLQQILRRITRQAASPEIELMIFRKLVERFERSAKSDSILHTIAPNLFPKAFHTRNQNWQIVDANIVNDFSRVWDFLLVDLRKFPEHEATIVEFQNQVIGRVNTLRDSLTPDQRQAWEIQTMEVLRKFKTDFPKLAEGLRWLNSFDFASENLLFELIELRKEITQSPQIMAGKNEQEISRLLVDFRMIIYRIALVKVNFSVSFQRYLFENKHGFADWSLIILKSEKRLIDPIDNFLKNELEKLSVKLKTRPDLESKDSDAAYAMSIAYYFARHTIFRNECLKILDEIYNISELGPEIRLEAKSLLGRLSKK